MNMLCTDGCLSNQHKTVNKHDTISTKLHGFLILQTDQQSKTSTSFQLSSKDQILHESKTYSMDTLACNRAFGATGSLLGGLIHQFASRSFDDTVLVRFGGVAVSRPVYKTLHHFLRRSFSSWGSLATEII